MFSIFKADPVKKLNKNLNAKLEQAMHAQRSGDIKGYSQLSVEAEKIREQILEAQEKQVQHMKTKKA
ncbi:DUF6435 family protein [Gammaproteobacteria bacterium AS21]|jgi:hypothetical protein